MDILLDTTGEFIFLVNVGDKWVPKYQQVMFTDLKDIPEDFEYHAVIKFVGNIAPPPHTLDQHRQIALLEREFNKYMKRRN